MILDGLIDPKDNEKADDLAADSGRGRAGNPHAQPEDQQRVKPYVQNRPEHESRHGVHGAALVPKLDVEHELGHHERRTYGDDPQVAQRVGKGFFRSAQEYGQRTEKDLGRITQ